MNTNFLLRFKRHYTFKQSFIAYSSSDVAAREHTYLGGKDQRSVSGRCSKPSRLALSKEARKAAFDKNRCRSIEMKSDDGEQANDKLADYSDDESGEFGTYVVSNQHLLQSTHTMQVLIMISQTQSSKRSFTSKRQLF